MFKDIKNKNYESLTMINDFIYDIDFKNTIFEYGAPNIIKENINFIGQNISYSDLICLLIKQHIEKPNYLEFGCSFGKNFWQIINNFQYGNYTVCDVEFPNHNVFGKLKLNSEQILYEEVFLNKKFISHKYSYNLNEKNINYYRGNLLNSKIYENIALENIKYNFIFSDAFHEDIGIRNEIDNILKYNLIDENFIIYFDDMEFDNEFEICKQKLNYFFNKPIYSYKFYIHGWIYEKEHKHKNAILTNLNLNDIMLKVI